MRKGKIFYTIYFTCIILFLAGMAWVLYWLYGWLQDYEASQPTAKCAEVFDELFARPDWGKIYDLAGIEDTVFEGRDAYIAYMEDKVGEAQLTCSETSAGLTGNKKYLVKLGEERLLSFTLVSSEQQDKGIRQWSLGEIVPVINREQSVRILKEQGHTAFVNGVELDEAYTVQRTETLAEHYLPEGVHGMRREMQWVEGLLTLPEITVADEKGALREVVYDPDTDTYVEQTERPGISGEEQKAVLAIAEGYCEYMIGATRDLPAFFDSHTEIYKTIRRNETWMQSYTGYTFEGENVTDYYRYTEALFSARVSLSLNVTRKNGTVKEYGLDANFFFEKQDDGSYLAVEMTNVDVQQPVTEVRLTFLNGEEVLKTEFVREDSSSLVTPPVTAPEGQTFLGWGKEGIDETGRKERVLLFVPDENGEVTLPDGYLLEPLTLYSLFGEQTSGDKEK